MGFRPNSDCYLTCLGLYAVPSRLSCLSAHCLGPPRPLLTTLRSAFGAGCNSLAASFQEVRSAPNHSSFYTSLIHCIRTVSTEPSDQLLPPFTHLLALSGCSRHRQVPHIPRPLLTTWYSGHIGSSWTQSTFTLLAGFLRPFLEPRGSFHRDRYRFLTVVRNRTDFIYSVGACYLCTGPHDMFPWISITVPVGNSNLHSSATRLGEGWFGYP